MAISDQRPGNEEISLAGQASVTLREKTLWAGREKNTEGTEEGKRKRGKERSKSEEKRV